MRASMSSLQGAHQGHALRGLLDARRRRRLGVQAAGRPALAAQRALHALCSVPRLGDTRASARCQATSCRHSAVHGPATGDVCTHSRAGPTRRMPAHMPAGGGRITLPGCCACAP